MAHERQPDPSTQEEVGGKTEQRLSGYAQFIFYKLDLAWRRLDGTAREQGIREFAEEVEKASGAGITCQAYSSVGLRPDVDFFLWNRSDTLLPIQQMTVRLAHTGLGKYLATPALYISLYRESPYPKLKDHEEPQLQNPKFMFVYPFVKQREWYSLPMEERGKAMREHVAVGHKYEGVRINTSYSFGLGDQEFVIAFDTDHPQEFEALVRRLRDTEASKWTLRDTPIYVGTAGSIREVLEQAA